MRIVGCGVCVCVDTGKCFVWFTFHSENNHFDSILNGLHKRKHSEDFTRSSRSLVVTEELWAKTNSTYWQRRSAFQREQKIQCIHPPAPVASQVSDGSAPSRVWSSIISQYPAVVSYNSAKSYGIRSHPARSKLNAFKRNILLTVIFIQ